MRQTIYTLLILFFLFLSKSCLVYSQYTVTVKSPSFSFNLLYPYDWHCENEYGLPQNIQAVLSPQAFMVDTSPATIYVRIVPRPSLKTSLKKFMKEDFLNAKKRRPTLQFGTDFILSTKDHKAAQVKTYFEEPQGLYDAIAYIPEKESFVIIILQTNSQKAYLRALPTFRNLVTSYQLQKPQEKVPSLPPLQIKKKTLKKKKPRPKRQNTPKKDMITINC